MFYVLVCVVVLLLIVVLYVIEFCIWCWGWCMCKVLFGLSVDEVVYFIGGEVWVV